MKKTKTYTAICSRSVIADKLLAWYEENGRDLLWRQDTTLYKVWISEVMLQQTRVDAVEPYFKRFLEKFPDMRSLADAPEEDVLHAWQGLGYYSRARNLRTGVSEVLARYGGELPQTRQEVESLTGVGNYTAGALLSIVHGIPEPAVDANVLRVFSRLFCLQQSISSASGRRCVTSLVREVIPADRPGDFNQAIMDLGSSICGREPQCPKCPLSAECLAYREGRQSQLPLKSKKTKPKPVSMIVGIFSKDGRYYLRKRPDDGLLGGMWEFPTVELLGEPVETLQSLLSGSARVDWVEYWCNLQHVFSHRVWNMQVYRCMVSDLDQVLPANGSWLKLSDINALPLGKPHRVIADWLSN